MAAEQHAVLEPLNEDVDHVRGPAGAPVILEYGDYECPFSRRAYRAIQQLEGSQEVRFAFRHFPLIDIHPHGLTASAAAEAAAFQGRFWEMHEILFHRQRALADDDLRGYADELGLDPTGFDRDRAGEAVFTRIRRDVRSGIQSGQVTGTPTLFIEGVLYGGKYDAGKISRALAA
jgi:protein-disulfide isomerase